MVFLSFRLQGGVSEPPDCVDLPSLPVSVKLVPASSALPRLPHEARRGHRRFAYDRFPPRERLSYNDTGLLPHESTKQSMTVRISVE